MRTVELTTNKELIRSITDEPLPNSVCFILYSDNKAAGVISLSPLNKVLWSPHILIKEEHRGNGSEEWGKRVAQEMHSRFGAKKFLAFTPYLAAKKYAEKIGFTFTGTLKNSIEINDVLSNQYVLELDVGETI